MATSLTKKSRLMFDGVRCGEVIDWTPVRPVEEEDTSIIDNEESAYTARVSIEVGTPEVTINMYDDAADPAQADIVLGQSGYEFIGYPTGDIVGAHKWTYSDCVVVQDDPGTIAFKGRLKRVVKIKANGGLVKAKVTV